MISEHQNHTKREQFESEYSFNRLVTDKKGKEETTNGKLRNMELVLGILSLHGLRYL